MADLAIGVVVIARLTPFAYLTTVLGAIPFAVLALRHRRQVLVVSFWISAVLGFLLTGFSAATQVIVMAVFGGIAGRAYANGWGRLRTALTAIALGWTLVSSLSVGLLLALPGFRRLNLDVAATQWEGSTRALERIGLGRLASFLDPAVAWSIEKWYLALPAGQLFFSVVVVLLIGRIGKPTVERVNRSVRTVHGDRPAPAKGAIEAVRSARGFTALTGLNGTGKSTLLRSVAIMDRDRLGKPGGVGWIGQRPDNQILGARVLDDLAWGLHPQPDRETLIAALGRVGLQDFERRETDSLSGGEQQRLAIAAALLRSPSLLLSDETTAMLDPAGRELVRMALRTAVAAGISVVHATHLDADIAATDGQIHLGSAQI